MDKPLTEEEMIQETALQVKKQMLPYMQDLSDMIQGVQKELELLRAQNAMLLEKLGLNSANLESSNRSKYGARDMQNEFKPPLEEKPSPFGGPERELSMEELNLVRAGTPVIPDDITRGFGGR